MIDMNVRSCPSQVWIFLNWKPIFLCFGILSIEFLLLLLVCSAASTGSDSFSARFTCFIGQNSCGKKHRILPLDPCGWVRPMNATKVFDSVNFFNVEFLLGVPGGFPSSAYLFCVLGLGGWFPCVHCFHFLLLHRFSWCLHIFWSRCPQFPTKKVSGMGFHLFSPKATSLQAQRDAIFCVTVCFLCSFVRDKSNVCFFWFPVTNN